MALHTCSPAWEECRKQSHVQGVFHPPPLKSVNSDDFCLFLLTLSCCSQIGCLQFTNFIGIYGLKNSEMRKKKNQWNGAVQIGLQTNREQGATTATSTTQGATFTLKVSVLHFRFVALFSFTAARLIVGQCSQTSVAQTSQCFPCKLHCPHPCLEWSKADFLI